MPTLPEDTTDDVLYFARTGDTSALTQTLLAASADPANGCPTEIAVLLAARDSESGNNAVHMAAANGHLETLKSILTRLPPATPPTAAHELVSHKNAAGNTPLHYAALNGHLAVVKLLLMSGNADPTVVNDAGHDAVFEAEANDKREVVEWVLGEFAGVEEAVGGRKEEEVGVEEGMQDMKLSEPSVDVGVDFGRDGCL